MKIIGITGGVGSGKSEVLKLIRDMCSCMVVTADELARSLEVRGEVCYEPLVALLGTKVLSEDGEIDPKKMAAAIFYGEDGSLLDEVNRIVHPAVKSRITQMIDNAAKDGSVDYFFIEAALLIEDHYDRIVDEMWYIYADAGTRRARLAKSRGYSDARIDGIMASQSSEATFRSYCRVVIDNSGSLDDTKKQLEKILNR